MKKGPLLLLVAIAVVIACISRPNPTYVMEELRIEDEMYMCFGCGDIVGVVGSVDGDLGLVTPESPDYQSWATRLLAEVDRVLISRLE